MPGPNDKIVIAVHSGSEGRYYYLDNDGFSWTKFDTKSNGRADHRGFLLTNDDTLLFNNEGTLYRYTGGGDSLTTVFTSYIDAFHHCLCQGQTVKIYLLEYKESKLNNTTKIFKSTDEG